MRDTLMINRIFLIVGLLAAGLLGAVPTADAAKKKSALKKAHSSRSYVLESPRRAQAPVVPQPRGPAYIYYDYPYDYVRGHYPTHIVRYVYYPRLYASRRGCPRQKGARKCR